MTRISLDEDLAGTLTPEEREALADTDAGGSPADADALRAVAGSAQADAAGDDSSDDDDDDDDDGDDDAQAADAAAAAPSPAAAPAAAPAPAPVAAADADVPQQFVYNYRLPEDYEQRVTALKSARSEVYDRLRSGEITVDELQAELEPLSEQQRELDSMRMQADLAQQTAIQAAEARRQAEIGRLFKSAKGDGIDYVADQAKMKDLDLFVKALANDEANADKPLSWFLSEGHRRVMAMHGKASPAPPPEPAGKRARIAHEDVPKTLAQVAGGQGGGDVGGEFDDIMSLDGEAFEEAIATMARRDPQRFARFQQSKQ